MDDISEDNVQTIENPFAGAYHILTPKFALQLAAPHTWPAAILPCLAAVCAAGVSTGHISILASMALLAICILFQAAANTFNDYFDYIKGADSADDNVEVSDSTLVYENLNPRHALILAIGFVVAAFLLGIFIVIRAGFVPLVIAIVGAAVVVLYSAGKTPLSYLPVGEIASGLFFGMIIPVAVFYSLTGAFDWRILLWSLPFVIGVGLIMMTNNTCDIEKDLDAGRRTLPGRLGRDRILEVYHWAILAWLVLIILFGAIFFTNGIIIAPFMLLAAWPVLKPLVANPLTPQTRVKAMGQILSVNVILGGFYSAIICASSAFALVA